jgi:glucose/arabinose dehydrogenase
MPLVFRPLALLLLGGLLAGCDAVQQQALKTYMAVEKGLTPEHGPVAVSSDSQDFEFVALTDAFEFPWGFDFLPDGRLLVTEKPGRLNLFNIDSRETRVLAGTPEVYYAGQGGLLDVAVHPEFERTGWIYLSAAVELEDGDTTTRIYRYRLEGDRLRDETLIFEATPAHDTRKHYGSAMLFDNDGYLFITIGDRGRRYLAQELDTAMGKILRLNDDGSVPPDNPLVDRADALPAIYSWGHRNPQGITIDRASGRVWAVEHGPQGGDEINLLSPGTN